MNLIIGAVIFAVGCFCGAVLLETGKNLSK